MKTILAVLVSFLFFSASASSTEIFGWKIPGTKAESISIPEVKHHDIGVTFTEIEEICQKRANEEELPCAIVLQDSEVCYAYMNLSGESEEVQCFRLVEEGYAVQ